MEVAVLRRRRGGEGKMGDTVVVWLVVRYWPFLTQNQGWGGYRKSGLKGNAKENPVGK